MELSEHLVGFMEQALSLDLECVLGCGECCLCWSKSCTPEEALNIRRFLRKEKGVNTRSLTNDELNSKLAGACELFGFACSIHSVKPNDCSSTYKGCGNKDMKHFIQSKGHAFHELELINIESYGKPINELTTDDLKAISSSIMERTRLLNDYFKHYDTKPLSGEELVELSDQIRVIQRSNLEKCFDRIIDKNQELSNKLSELNLNNKYLSDVNKKINDKKIDSALQSLFYAPKRFERKIENLKEYINDNGEMKIEITDATRNEFADFSDKKIYDTLYKLKAERFAFIINSGKDSAELLNGLMKIKEELPTAKQFIECWNEYKKRNLADYAKISF